MSHCIVSVYRARVYEIFLEPLIFLLNILDNPRHDEYHKHKHNPLGFCRKLGSLCI